MRTSRLSAYLLLLLALLVAIHTSAQAQPLVHPKNQIALQLGAIQMGYPVPFAIVRGNATNAQQAANALLMGSNAMAATVAKPAVEVVDVVSSPRVNTEEFRNQLYAAVEHVITSPASGAINGRVRVKNSSRPVIVKATLALPSNDWTIPVPYAVESLTSVTSLDSQALIDVLASAGLVTKNFSPSLIEVQGGTLPQSSGLAGSAVNSFLIGNYEVTYGEWSAVAKWSSSNGYDIRWSGSGLGGQSPVTAVSWYDALKWCNAKSEMEGLVPVYEIGGTLYRTGHGIPSIRAGANGYRLPTEKEWEFAARGGNFSQGYEYSGSNNLVEVGWYAVVQSSPYVERTMAVGMKLPNELGISDMSGNVWEWCWDGQGASRRVRGGSFTDNPWQCAVGIGYSYPADLKNGATGFRIARNSP